ncbi:hypothetical protein TWF694_002935 [Orbilia ellipsospora]|uniref:Carboxypeptidase M14A n=1 Tax=Orbilia ellipsospora TaxID=2528407 RepID=A0AAV9X1E1_9PEZI
MYFSKTQILAILAFTGAVTASPVSSAVQKVSHKGTRVVRLETATEKDVAFVKGLVDNLHLDTWTHNYNVGSHVDVAVPVSAQPVFDRLSERAGLKIHVMHADLGASIEEESRVSTLGTSSRVDAGPDPNWFTAYHPYAAHLTYLNSLASSFPDHAEVVTSGQSTQGQTITGIHIWGGTKGKPAMVIHGNVHAREWITSKVTEYFAHSLLTSSDAATKYMTDNYDFYIFPVVNPDGFVYSQTTNRMWRKNRLGSGSCIGTDINRNWDYKWNLSGGASTSKCAEDYKGTAAGSTAEFKGLSAFLKNLKDTVGVKLYIDYHSYSQLILAPYGYTCNDAAPDAAEHMRVMKEWEAAMEEPYKTTFEYGPTCQTIYPTTGDSADYTYGALGIVHSYAVELRDTGSYGFILPATQITPSGVEAWAGLQALVRTIKL